eukprot:m.37670 g.37670  ORF g.37670 m.37670 type:complete len:611 (-) comp9338_c0_seq2:59-1891(-)
MVPVLLFVLLSCANNNQKNGISSNQIPSNSSCATYLNQTCFRNKGYRLIKAASPGECCTECAEDNTCVSWTFLSGPSSINCHLKDTEPNATERQSCENGFAGYGNPPTPTPLPPKGTMNVVFIVIDDLRPELGNGTAYNQSSVITPHLNEFAKTSLTFTLAYVQYSHCSPSRNSFLSGRSPQTTGVYNFIDSFREDGYGANWTSLPEWFKKAGFTTLGGGKVFHPNKPANNDMPLSWDSYYFHNGDDQGCRENGTIYSNVCPSSEPDNAFYDNMLVTEAISQIKQSKGLNRPFFIAAGLRRPHRVWHVPRAFYDLYANNGTFPTDMKLAEYKLGPEGMPELAYIDNAWPGFPYNQSSPIPDYIAALGRWGYYASVSFTDYNVGLILDTLDTEGLADNTVVAFTGDHGWQLGEHGEWCKRTNFELGVRVPMMIRSPAHKMSYGQHTPHFFESLDLYRTLAALAYAGVDKSKMPPIESTVEGDDLSPIFQNPSSPPIKTAAFSQMARCPATGTLGPESACNSVKREDIAYMGYTVRVQGWRYTVWIGFNGTRNRGIWPSSAAPMAELYDHSGNNGTSSNVMDAYENENVVEDAKNQPLVASLYTLLKNRFDT